MAATWRRAPTAATTGLLVPSAQHFGYRDLHHPQHPRWRRRTLAASRGVMVVGATVLAEPSVSALFVLGRSPLSRRRA